MKRKIFSLLYLTVILTACQNASHPLIHEPFTDEMNPLTTFKSEQGDIYYKKDNITPLVVEPIEGVNIKTGINQFKEINDVNIAFNTNSYVLSSNDINNPNNYIEQNLLVAPVYFTDSSVASNDELKSKKKILLQNAFFGDEKVTNYQSVASYYNRSSYGHLKIKGEVLDWISIPQSSAEVYVEGKSSPENYSDKVARMIVDQLSEDVFKKYSKNHEDIIDSLYIVYDYPYQTNKKNNEDSIFWAYTYHCKNISGTRKISQYAWSSFDFVGNKAINTNRVDATTFIHETGHLLGLLDYYNKSGSSSYQPLGFMDMMDYNLGDHSPLSKYLLNWVSPYILDLSKVSSGDITINDFSKSGDFILIPNKNYNGTAYDRYLLISMFTPKGLNDLTDFPSYEYVDKNGEKNIFTYPNKYGVLLYEVNANLGYYKYTTIRSSTPTCMIDSNPGEGDYIINFYYDNEVNNSSDKPFYHLLESSGNNTFLEGKSASNDSLFKLNSTFGIDTYVDLAEEFGVTFKISKLGTEKATISFNKK